LFITNLSAGTDTRSPAHQGCVGREINNDQVRRWREVLSDGAETPGEKIAGLCRTIGVALAAKNLAAAGGFCIRILQVSRMFHPASVGVSDAMQSCLLLRRR
jgi:hypothetical protein